MNKRRTLRMVWVLAAGGMVGSASWSIGLFGSALMPMVGAQSKVFSTAGAKTAASRAGALNTASASGPTVQIDGQSISTTDLPPEVVVSEEPAPSEVPVSNDTPNIRAALSALDTTCTSTNPPQVDPGDPPPGEWWNPKRWGTGWTLAYEPGHQTMRVVWHTFYPRVGGGQTWLVSDKATVVAAAGGKRTWTAGLYRTEFGKWGGRRVGDVTLVFPGDSATRASLEWSWNDSAEGINSIHGSECLYSFFLDRPSTAPSLVEPQPASAPASASLGPQYTGIWFDNSTPGFVMEVAMGSDATQNVEFDTFSIYDTDKKPLWLWSSYQYLKPAWPPTGWTENEAGYRTANYNMAISDCSNKVCAVRSELMFRPPAHFFGRTYKDLDRGVVALSVASTPTKLSWPPPKSADWPDAPPSGIAGCPHGVHTCRPIQRQTDTESLWVSRTWCDVSSVNSTCTIGLGWWASVLGVVERLKPDADVLLPHAGDDGMIGGAISGEFIDTLVADERVRYRLKIGGRQIMTIAARAAFSRILASSPCVIPLGATTCPVTVTWSTPDPAPNNFIYVYRVATPIGGGTPTRTLFASQISSGTRIDNVGRGVSVYYDVVRNLSGVLDSTSSNPTIAVEASITAAPTQCSVPLNQFSCPIAVTWLAGTANAQVKRVDLNGGANNLTLSQGASGTVTDNLPRDSHVQYVVTVGSAEQARSADVSAITSSLTTDPVTKCIVQSGQSTCAIAVSWTSTAAALVYRVDESGGGRTQIGSNFTGTASDALAPGARVHYELTISAVLHAITPAVTAEAGSEGGDSNDGVAEVPSLPSGFVEPSLDVSADRVGAIAGEFRVDEGGGAAYRIPLAVSPGAGGLAPSLAISYNSGGGDGALGTGFALEGLSAITPCRPSFEAGDSGGPTATPSELCLDGQRLLLVSGIHWQVNAEYRTEVESFQRVKLTNVESPSVAGIGRLAYVFTVEGKDGSVRTFGGAAGTVFGQSGPNLASPLPVAAQGWLQTQLKDVVGNAITFAYSSIETLGERYLRRLTYSGGSVVFSHTASPRTDVAYSALGLRKQSQLLSGIEVRGANGTTLRYYELEYNTASATWASYRPHLLSLKECASQGGPCFPATNFAWSEASPQVEDFTGKMGSGLGYFQFGDLNGDERADLWWTSNARAGGRNNQLHISKSVADAKGKPTLTEVPALNFLLPDGFSNGGLWEVYDFNGDGRDDLVYAWPNRDAQGVSWITWIRRLSTGDGLGPEEVLFKVPVDAARVAELSAELAVQHADAGQGAGALNPAVPNDVRYLGSSMLVDVDGDGLPDLVFRSTDGSFWVALTQRTGNPGAPYAFNPIRATFLNEAGSPVGDRCGFATADLSREEENFSQAMDFDGDGRADLRFIVNANGCAGNQGYRLDVFLSRGIRASDGAFVFQAARPFGDVFVKTDSLEHAAQQLRTADVNADGLADLVYTNGLGVWHYRLGGPNSGTTDACVVWCTFTPSGKTIQLLDFDGDGKLDFWAPNGNKYEVYLWAGDRWVATPSSSTGIQTGYGIPDDTWNRITADFDGDGDADNLIVRPSDGTWHLQRSVNHHRPRGVVTQIVNGLGAKTTLDYAPLTYSSVYLRDYDAPFMTSGRGSPVFDLGAPSFVVSRVASSAPTPTLPNQESKVSYRYAGLKVQAGGRGSLGFRRMSTVDAQTQIEVDSYYLQRFPYTGLAEFTQTRRLGAEIGIDICASPDSPSCMKYVPPCAGGTNATCDVDLPGIGNGAGTIRESVDQWQARIGAKAAELEPICADSGSGSSATTPISGTDEGELICTASGQPPVMPGELVRRTLAAVQSPIFLARIESLTGNYDLALGVPGGVVSSESVLFPLADFDAYGNPQSSTTSKIGGGTTVATRSVLAYDNDATTWKLSRLRSAAVQTTRSVAGGATLTNSRKSSFSYANGLLTSEKVEAMTGAFPNGLVVDATAPVVAKYYSYDSFGNKVKTAVCSTGIAEATCRQQSASGGGGYQFHPTNAADVMRYSRVDYDSLGRFADVTTEAFSNGGTSAREVASARVVARNAAGDPTEISDANNVPAKIRYGALGRKRFTWAPNGATTRWDANYCSGSPMAMGMPTAPCPSGLGLAYVATTRTAGAPTSMVFYDLLGRPTLALTQGFVAGSWNATITQYDASGNVKRQSHPFPARDTGTGAATSAPGASITWIETTYDTLSRPTKVLDVSTNSATTITYSALKTVTTAPINGSGFIQTATEFKNGLGEVVRAIDANSFEVSTDYDAAGNPLAIHRGALVTTMGYDGLGRKTAMTDPDAGTWSYTLNGAGETIRQVSPSSQCTTSERDGRGRVWRRRDFTNAACTALESDATVAYDTAVGSGIGALAQETNGLVSHTPSYDSLGRATKLVTTQEGKSYTEQWTFDQVGRPFQHFFAVPGLPSTGERSVYTPDGFLAQVRSAYPQRNGTFPVYREILEVNVRGEVTKERGAAGAEYTQERGYDPNTGRLTRLLAQSSTGGLLQDLSYGYDLIGNVMSRGSRTNTQTVTETFVYDILQRQRSATVSGAGSFARSQSYDAQGNITQKADAGVYTYGTRPVACASNAIPGPHAVSEVSGVSLCYDASGNVVKQVSSLGSETFQYTAANQVSDIRDGVSNTRVGFGYGPNRERVRRVDYASNIAVSAESVVHEVGDAQIRYTAGNGNVPAGLQELRRTVGNVLIVQTGSSTSARLQRLILLTDAQGSTHQVLGALTLQPVNPTSPSSFDSWGRRRNGTDWTAPVLWTAGLDSLLRGTTTHGYTGHEMAESVGVIHMNGRIFDPQLARFLQADPYVQSPGNGQSWNRYSYGFNNPMMYTDPTGYWGASERQWVKTIAAIVITVYTGGAAAGSWGFMGLTAAQASANAYAVIAVGGFAAGAVQTGTLRGAVTGAVTAAAFYGIGSAFSQGNAGWAYDGGNMNFAGYAAKTLSHGAAGGVMAELQGGRFGNGFASAGVSEALSPVIGSIRSTPGQAVAVAVVGGTASTLAGGKFANGAVTASFGFAFNQLAHPNGGPGYPREDVTFDEWLTKANGVDIEWPTDSRKITSPYGSRNVPGGSRYHNGVDMRAHYGDPIYSTQDGTILDISVAKNGRGEIFISNNDGSLSGYAHVGPTVGIATGTSIVAGSQIGFSNASGLVKNQGAHLHYTYRLGTVFSPASINSPTVNPIINQLDNAQRP